MDSLQSNADREPGTDVDQDDLGVSRAMLTTFATPVVNYHWKDSDALNGALRSAIADAGARGDAGTSGVYGWRSSPDFINWNVECVRELRSRLQRFAVELTRLVFAPRAGKQRIHFHLTGQAEVMRPGHYGEPRSDAGTLWTGVYQVSDNEVPAEHPMSGKVELLDPRPGAVLAMSDLTTLYGRFFVSPTPGQMVVFPSWLQHRVHPYFGSAPRISVVFHVRIERAA